MSAPVLLASGWPDQPALGGRVETDGLTQDGFEQLFEGSSVFVEELRVALDLLDQPRELTSALELDQGGGASVSIATEGQDVAHDLAILCGESDFVGDEGELDGLARAHGGRVDRAEPPAVAVRF